MFQRKLPFTLAIAIWNIVPSMLLGLNRTSSDDMMAKTIIIVVLLDSSSNMAEYASKGRLKFVEKLNKFWLSFLGRIKNKIY